MSLYKILYIINIYENKIPKEVPKTFDKCLPFVSARAVSRGQLERTSRSMPSGCGSRHRELAHAQPQPRGGLQQATQAKPSQASSSEQTKRRTRVAFVAQKRSGCQTSRSPCYLYLFIKNKRDEETRIE